MVPLISSQRYLDPATVARKARTFKVFIVNVLEVSLRGRPYRVLIDGHHNLAASRMAGVEPTWRGAPRKFDRIFSGMAQHERERFLINNLTDSDWYYVDTGAVVNELLTLEKEPTT